MNYEQVKLSAFADELIKITKHHSQKVANAPPAPEHKEPAPKSEKEQVYEAIIHKYPHLAARGESIKSAAAALAIKEPGLLNGIANHLVHNERAYELAGLGTLMAMPADEAQAHLRKEPGQSDEDSFEQRSLLGGHMGHAALDTAGLGMMAVPLALAMHRGHQ